MPATSRGIYHNLRESIYLLSNDEIVLFFSSTLYLHKFIKGYKDNRKHFLNRVPVEHLNMQMLADIAFYTETEKRGFLVWLKGIEITCEDLHRYALRKMTEKSIQDWQKIQKPKLEERMKIMG